jgi:hypothetical protein
VDTSAGLLCILLAVLAVVTLVGHGIWVLVALAWKAMFGPGVQKRDLSNYPQEDSPFIRTDAVEAELRDLAVTERELRRLLQRDALDPVVFDQILGGVRRRRLELGAPERRLSPAPHPEKKPEPARPAVPAEAILDVLPVEPPAPAAPPPEQALEKPVALPRLPRRTLGEVLAAFMEEHNILWGELAGGLLIVGCSVALVVYLWQTQQEIRYFPFFVVAGVTAALFGAGAYAQRRWKLETTSRGLLIIATLLVPLSFLVLAGLPRGEEGGWTEAGTQVAALGIFAWLVSRAGGVLAGPDQMPGGIDGRWLLAATVLISSGAQLLVARLVDSEHPNLTSFVLLGLVPTACHGLATGLVLSRARGGVLETHAHTLFVFVGMATFPLAVELGFLVYWCDDPALALERIAALVALAGAPVLATGVLVHSAPLSGPLRAVGTGIALGGMLVLLAAVVMAWPQPVALVLVCALDFAVLSALAWRNSLPVAHAAALPCLAVGYLTAYHLLTGGLDVARGELGDRLLHVALTPMSGGALTALAVLLAASAELFVRIRRQADGLYYAASAGILAVVSLALVAEEGLHDPGQAGLVYAICSVSALLANVRWTRAWLTYAGAATSLGAIAYGLHWIAPALRPERLWLLALLATATAALTGSAVLQRRYQPGAQARGPVHSPSIALQASDVFVVPLRFCAVIASAFALFALLAAVGRDWMIATAECALWLACVWLALAWIRRSPGFFASSQALLFLAVAFAATAWLDGQGWIEAPPTDLVSFQSLHTYGIWLASLSLLFVVARLALRSRPRVRQLLEPSWPALDRVVIGCLVLGLLGMAVVGIAPAMVAEWTPTVDGWIGSATDATGPGAWGFLGMLALVLITALWDRLPAEALLGLVFLALTIPLLMAGVFAVDRASASAIRWGLAICFVVCSAAIWLRDPLARFAAGVGIRLDGTRRLPGSVRGVLLGGAVAPLLVLTVIVASLQMARESLGGPMAGSFFARLGPLASILIPLVLVILALVGHAVRERTAGYAFAAGVIADLTLMGGYGLGVVISGNEISDAPWVFVLQLGTLGAATWAGVWLLSRRRLPAWREGPENPRARPLMRVQLATAIAGNLVLLAPMLMRLFVVPEEPLSDGQAQVGDAAGWLALLASAGVVFWHASETAKWLRVHILGALAAGIVLLLASAFNPMGQPWISYHVLVAAGAVHALAFLSAGIVAASPRLSEVLLSALSVPREVGEGSHWYAWLVELLPAQAVQAWLHGIGLALAVLGVRGGWTDPERPYWSVAAVMTAAVVAAALAVWSRRQHYVYVSGLLANLAGILVWVARGPDTLTGFLVVNAMCLALASFAWTAIELALRQPPLAIELRGKWPFAHAALVAAISLLGIVAASQMGQGWEGEIPQVDAALAWLALGATAAACALLLWDAKARFVFAGLYATGILAVTLALADMELSPARFWWLIAASLSAYVLGTSGVRSNLPALRDLGQRIAVPERIGGWPVAWFSVAQAVGASVVAVVSIWMVLAFETLRDRLAGPLAAAMLVPAAVLLAGAADRWQNAVRYAALALGVIAGAELSWALLDPATRAPWLHRNALLLVALAVMTAIYGLGLPRLLRHDSKWLLCIRQTGPVLAVLAAVQLLVVLGHEAAHYNPDQDVRTTPLAWWGVLTVAVGFGLLVVAVLRFAITPGRDPFGLTERGRMLYVYAAEMLAVLLLVHLRLNVLEMFPPFVARYWPLIVMCIAFLGVGLAEWFERRGWRVLAEPVRRTGVFLPLLPLMAFWVRDWTGLREASQNVPALSPLLRYLERMEGGFGLHASVWFILGMLYATVAVSRRSFLYALLAALAANFGLWVIFANVRGMQFMAHPQLWLIPLSLILLVAEHVNRDKLTEAQAAALRYLALSVLYVSSTADMFIAGIGNSVALPIVLALLSVLGILAGILLRVRAFLFQGLTFLFVVVFTMIWHAAVQRGQTWVWYVSGIVLGVAILALFALFEKRRNEVAKVVQELKRWE